MASPGVRVNVADPVAPALSPTFSTEEPAPPVLRVFEEVMLEDEATKMVTKYRLELSSTEITLNGYDSPGGAAAGGSGVFEMHLPLHAFARPETGGGGLFGQGVANPFFIRAQVATGQDEGGPPANIKLTFGGRKADRDVVFAALSSPPPAPASAQGGGLTLQVAEPLAAITSAAALRDMHNPDVRARRPPRGRRPPLTRACRFLSEGDQCLHHAERQRAADAISGVGERGSAQVRDPAGAHPGRHSQRAKVVPGARQLLHRAAPSAPLATGGLAAR